MITVKLDKPEQERYLNRCIESIRMIYPDILIVIVTARDTELSLIPDENTRIEENPYFSTLGAMHLFHMNRYADHACILHDTMTLVKALPSYAYDIMFLYHFEDYVYDHHAIYKSGYDSILQQSDVSQLISTLRYGCFGCACILHWSTVETIGLLTIIPKIKLKYDFECMERILGYLAIKHKVLPKELSLCGDIVRSIANPWTHPHYDAFSNQDITTVGFPYTIFKSACGRL